MPTDYPRSPRADPQPNAEISMLLFCVILCLSSIALILLSPAFAAAIAFVGQYE